MAKESENGWATLPKRSVALITTVCGPSLRGTLAKLATCETGIWNRPLASRRVIKSIGAEPSNVSVALCKPLLSRAKAAKFASAMKTLAGVVPRRRPD